jgi:hypothetical protein
VRAELTKRLDVKPGRYSGRGRSSQFRILDRWAANTAALKAPRRKTPFPGAARRLLNLLSTDGWGYRGRFMNEIARSKRIKNVVSLQVARERRRQPRGDSNRHVSKGLLERIEAENAQLRGMAAALMLEIQALRDALGRPQSETQIQ